MRCGLRAGVKRGEIGGWGERVGGGVDWADRIASNNIKWKVLRNIPSTLGMQLAVDGDHVGNLCIRQRVGFHLAEPPHPGNNLVGALEDDRYRRCSFADEVANDPTKWTKQRRRSTSSSTVEHSLLMHGTHHEDDAKT